MKCSCRAAGQLLSSRLLLLLLLWLVLFTCLQPATH